MYQGQNTGMCGRDMSLGPNRRVCTLAKKLPGHVSGTCCSDTSTDVRWHIFTCAHAFWAKFVLAKCRTEFSLLNFMGHAAATELCVRRHDHPGMIIVRLVAQHAPAAKTDIWANRILCHLDLISFRPLSGFVFPIRPLTGAIAFFVFTLLPLSFRFFSLKMAFSLKWEIIIRVWLTSTKSGRFNR